MGIASRCQRPRVSRRGKPRYLGHCPTGCVPGVGPEGVGVGPFFFKEYTQSVGVLLLDPFLGTVALMLGLEAAGWTFWLHPAFDDLDKSQGCHRGADQATVDQDQPDADQIAQGALDCIGPLEAV